MTFDNLLKGSYNHYWAFEKALKGQGVTEGCCTLGADFCHPEYPQNDKGGMGKKPGEPHDLAQEQMPEDGQGKQWRKGHR